MIEVNERIDVPAPPHAVWELLSNPPAVVDCVPGAALGDAQEDGSYDATMVVKFGPAKITFSARVTLELDAAAMVGQVSSKGRDNQGGTRFSAKMTFSVVEQTEPPGSAIDITAKVEITGRLSTLVESGASLVVKYMTSEFSKRLAARFTEAEARK